MIYLFADRTLDPDRRELRRGADPMEVEPQVFDLLLYLIRHRDRVVTRDELIAAVWKGRIVSESTISSRIALARHAAGDTGREQRLIRTLPRVGLRFVGDVQERSASASGDAAQPGSGPSGRAHDEPGGSARAAPIVFRRPLLAVRPFRDMSAATDRRHLIAGIVEDIATALSPFPWLSVIVRSPGQGAGDWAVDIADPDGRPAVHYLLDGSVRTGDHRIRVTTRLLDPSTGALLWAKRFDAWHEDLLELQDQVTASVVGRSARGWNSSRSRAPGRSRPR